MARKKSWKRLLIEARELAESGRGTLYEIVQRSVAVFDDSEFREEQDMLSDDDAADWLTNELFSDCALTFLELRAVFQSFPDADDWASSTVRRLYDQLQAVEPRAATKERITISWKKRAMELEKALAEMTNRALKAEKAHAEAMTEVSRLLGRVDELETLFNLHMKPQVAV